MARAEFRPTWLSYEDIRQRARDLRRRYGHDDDVVFPIERVVEYDLKLDIVPVPGLRQAFPEWGACGYLTQDRTEIRVDSYCCQAFEDSFRFTLAHEVAHLELHAELWDLLVYSDPGEYIGALQSLVTDERYKGLEWQADAFAGVVLVPDHLLRPRFLAVADRVCSKLVGREDVPKQTRFDVALSLVCAELSEQFEQYEKRIAVRADYEGLSDELAGMLFGSGHKVETRRRMLPGNGP